MYGFALCLSDVNFWEANASIQTISLFVVGERTTGVFLQYKLSGGKSASMGEQLYRQTDHLLETAFEACNHDRIPLLVDGTAVRSGAQLWDSVMRTARIPEGSWGSINEASICLSKPNMRDSYVCCIVVAVPAESGLEEDQRMRAVSFFLMDQCIRRRFAQAVRELVAHRAGRVLSPRFRLWSWGGNLPGEVGSQDLHNRFADAVRMRVYDEPLQREDRYEQIREEPARQRLKLDVCCAFNMHQSTDSPTDYQPFRPNVEVWELWANYFDGFVDRWTPEENRNPGHLMEELRRKPRMVKALMAKCLAILEFVPVFAPQE